MFMGKKCFQVFVDEASRDKLGLKMPYSATDATAAYIDEMAREGVAIKYQVRQRRRRGGTRAICDFFKDAAQPHDQVAIFTAHIGQPKSNRIAERATKQLIMQPAPILVLLA